jgi:hypothetical protein
MNDRFRVRVLAGSLLALAVAAGIGVAAYNMGVAHGLAESGKFLNGPGGVPYVYGWPRPWGFGFGFFFFPFLMFAFWFFVIRMVFWRGPWHGWRYRDSGVPPMFEEWHRRAHAESPQTPAQKA